MLTKRKPFLALTAGDLMKFPVVTVPQGMTLQTAARILKREQITGAPVVDEEGHCVGVLSATDFVTLTERGGCRTAPCPEEPCFAEWQVLDVEGLPREEVRSLMSRDVVTVPASSPIGELARLMLDAHIHRLFVVDSERRPVGVVTSTDIIGAVAGAVGEGNISLADR
jgi:CBS domain-containing protein